MTNYIIILRVSINKTILLAINKILKYFWQHPEGAEGAMYDNILNGVT